MGASNLHYHQWESHVALADETTFGTVGTTPKTWPVLAPPRVNVNPNFIDTGETGRGRAERSRDQYALGSKESGVTFESRAGVVFLYKMLASLLQVKPAGVESPVASGFFKHTFLVYSEQPAANVGYSFWHAWRAGATGHSRRTVGNMNRMVGLRSEENSVVRMPVESMALNGTRETLAAPASAWSSPLLWTHRHLITALVGVTPVGVASLDLSMNNGLTPWFGGSQTPSEIVLGIFGITGSFVVSSRVTGSAGLDAFLAKDNVVLTFGYGTVVDEPGYAQIKFDATYSGADDVDRNGIQGISLPFASALNDVGTTVTTIDLWHTADLAA